LSLALRNIINHIAVGQTQSHMKAATSSLSAGSIKA